MRVRRTVRNRSLEEISSRWKNGAAFYVILLVSAYDSQLAKMRVLYASAL